MAKEVVCVYQDCVMCGDRGRKLKQIIDDNGLDVRKVSFASDEGRELVHKAVFVHGIKTMPFYTDGSLYSTSIMSFVKKKTKKSKKGDKNGDNK